MKTSTVYPIITDQLTPVLLEYYFNHVLKSQTANNLTINLKILFTLVDPVEKQEYSPHRTAYITVDNKNCNFKRTCEVEVMYKLVSETRELYLELLQKVGDKEINCLTIGYNERTYHESYNDFISLDTIFNHCTSLKHLQVQRVNNVGFDGSTTQLYQALERLRLNGCFVLQDAYSEISKRCTNLKILEFFNFGQIDDPEDPVPDFNFTEIVMPSTYLEKLCFYYSIDGAPGNHDHVFIKLETHRKKTRYCQVTFSNQVSFNCDLSEEDYEFALEEDGFIVVSVVLEAATKFIIETDVKMEDDTFRKGIYVEEDL